jgi:hypothetical protein
MRVDSQDIKNILETIDYKDELSFSLLALLYQSYDFCNRIYDKDHNKKLIEKIYKEGKEIKVIHIFELTFKELFIQYFHYMKYIPEILGIIQEKFFSSKF